MTHNIKLCIKKVNHLIENIKKTTNGDFGRIKKALNYLRSSGE